MFDPNQTFELVQNLFEPQAETNGIKLDYKFVSKLSLPETQSCPQLEQN